MAGSCQSLDRVQSPGTGNGGSVTKKNKDSPSSTRENSTSNTLCLPCQRISPHNRSATANLTYKIEQLGSEVAGVIDHLDHASHRSLASVRGSLIVADTNRELSMLHEKIPPNSLATFQAGGEMAYGLHERATPTLNPCTTWSRNIPPLSRHKISHADKKHVQRRLGRPDRPPKYSTRHLNGSIPKRGVPGTPARGELRSKMLQTPGEVLQVVNKLPLAPHRRGRRCELSYMPGWR